MRRVWPIALLLAMPASQPAHAQGAGDLDVQCFAQQPQLLVVLPGAAAMTMPKGSTSEAISLDGLVNYSKEDAQGNVLRTGSNTVERACGALRLRVSGGYYNANPQGELGAEDYPIVEVLDGSRSLTGRVALGSCSAGVPRESIMAECPAQWATLLRIVADPHDRYSASMSHAYEETRTP